MKKNSLFLVAASIVFLLGSHPAEASELEAGRAFFKKNRCSFCHTIEGSGGKLGADLSTIGTKRDRDWFLKFFENPKKLVPTAKMMPVKGSEKELSALAAYLLAQK